MDQSAGGHLMVDLVLIAAVAENGIIGADNRLLWRLKTDMKHFRALTMGMPVIMGRKTYDSIGKPLPGRHIIVVTRQPDFAPAGVRVAHSLEDARQMGNDIAVSLGGTSVFVAGGGEIYAALMPVADRLEITAVALAPEGDAVFPPIDPAQWQCVQEEKYPKTADDEAAFSFCRYRRR